MVQSLCDQHARLDHVREVYLKIYLVEPFSSNLLTSMVHRSFVSRINGGLTMYIIVYIKYIKYINQVACDPINEATHLNLEFISQYCMAKVRASTIAVNNWNVDSTLSRNSYPQRCLERSFWNSCSAILEAYSHRCFYSRFLCLFSTFPVPWFFIVCICSDSCCM